MSEQEIIEAALFAAGRAVSLEKLIKITGKPKKTVLAAVNSLIENFRARESGLEILDLGERYVMQVKPQYSELMEEVAPRELNAPKLRTLAMIAYHQPVLQSDLIEMRGSTAYEHIKDLIERGFVESEPSGRTRELSTTSLFADYFGLKKNDPAAVKEKMLKLLKEQGGQSSIEKWIGKKTVAVTPMYESLMKMCGIKDYLVINAYSPSKEEISKLLEADVLVVSAGYLERVSKYCDGEILEARSTTFGDLIEDISAVAEELPEEVDKKIVEENLREIKEIREKYVSSALLIAQKVKPATEMVAKLVNDLNLGVAADGVLIAPDYKSSSSGVNVSAGAKVLMPTHKSVGGNLLERVCAKYEAILEGLKNSEKLEKRDLKKEEKEKEEKEKEEKEKGKEE